MRVKARFPSSHGTSGHRIFTAAIIIASKTLHDQTYTNKTWTSLVGGGFSLRELNQMERDMCKFLDWDLQIDHLDLEAFEKVVVAGYSQDSDNYPLIPLALISKRFKLAEQFSSRHGTAEVYFAVQKLQRVPASGA
ncbi:hypothetical protein D9611_008064 [Ephemerocybe angulata]|uniref:Cyclin N-terminal domain-containing protein n=1 Tax=Ephemerocybe angulata TaxID=980116 RepID=A0A8H5C095_9AGAR|nr:hypothetical protein D9611_008064 [Tulosesus angulatus]